ncbi:lipolysis-stimulated lipoprotein receptor-like [Amia ocellicauda]|uniref:lipolysis-stimulated lipoprotein receptor-like n=1 Tax=Amia ocellicauda TaxID=2972642 RepID=UPI0034642B2C
MLLRLLFFMTLSIGSSMAISVTCPTKRYVVILFQPVTLTCNYQTSAQQPPVVIWRYKYFCLNPILTALNPSSAANQLTQAIPNYNPIIDCTENQRTVRTVASKQGNTITLADGYQGRKITIINNADLNFAQTAWGDSGVYVCSVVSTQDLTGNSEDYTELIVLDWLLVVLVVLGFLLFLLLIGICWCQCCPHTCCCYVRCPCCPDRCCCPQALYEAGKAATYGVPSLYAPTLYAPTMYSQPPQAKMMPPAMPMMPIHNSNNGYMRAYYAASSVRSGYRIQANQADNSTRVLYYMERELANLDPARPGANRGKYDRLSEVSSLHEDRDPRGILREGMGRVRNQAMMPIMDADEHMSTISSVSQQGHYRDDASSREGARGGASRGRAHSMDNLDELGRTYYDDSYRAGGGRGRSSDDEWSGWGYDRDDRRRRDYSPNNRRKDAGVYKRSHSRDDLMDLERGRGPPPRGVGYDDSFLEEALRRKRMNEQQRVGSRERLDSDSEAPSSRSGRGGDRRGPDRRRYSDDYLPPPPPPPYSDTESKKSDLRKNSAVSRESLVV